jgi:pimeloyl-ACP methyl ester carboxylesterase
VTPIEIATPRGRFAAVACGPLDGSLVVLLHGFPDTPRSWAPVADRLAARGLRVVAPFLRGYFPSPCEGPYDVDTLADDLDAQLGALVGDAGATIVGHDWGAVVTYAAATRHRARVRSAITIAVPHPIAFVRALTTIPAQARRSGYMGLFQVPWLSDRIVAARDFAFVDALWSRWSPGLVPDDAARAALHACLRESMPAPLSMYRAMAWPPRAALARLRDGRRRTIDAPTLHLQGERDGCIAIEACAGQARFFAGPFESRVLAGAGHFAQLEVPDAIAAAIVDWRARHERA